MGDETGYRWGGRSIVHMEGRHIRVGRMFHGGGIPWSERNVERDVCECHYYEYIGIL